MNRWEPEGLGALIYAGAVALGLLAVAAVGAAGFLLWRLARWLFF